MPRSFGIIELGKKSRKIFEFKGLICKIFRNKDLAYQRALKMGLGQLRGPSCSTDTPRNCPNQSIRIAPGGLEVCDGGHRLGVMKKVKRLTASAISPVFPWARALGAAVTKSEQKTRTRATGKGLLYRDPHLSRLSGPARSAFPLVASRGR